MNEPPPSVLRAVRAMQAGMAASFVGIALNLVTDLSSPGAVRSALRQLEPHVTTAQIAADQRVLIGESIAAGLLEAALWLWMAQSCRAGKGWARIVSTVLFGIFTAGQAASLAVGSVGIGLMYQLVVWLIGLVAVVFLWRKPSNEYFRGASRLY